MKNTNIKCKNRNCLFYKKNIYDCIRYNNKQNECKNYTYIRRFEEGDEKEASKIIRKTIKLSNSKDYSKEIIDSMFKIYSPKGVLKKAKESHFYIVANSEKIIGTCGIIKNNENSDECSLISIFVLPDFQGLGIGNKIIEVLEADDIFKSSKRIEIASSIAAINFYIKYGYKFKDGLFIQDELGGVHLEKIKNKYKKQY